MTPQDHWNAIKLANPHYNSPNKNGWHFPKDEPRASRRQLITRAWIVGLVVVCGVVLAILIQQG